VITFILVVLLLAAIFGALAVVVKTAIVIALSIILAITFVIAFGYYWFRYRVYRFRKELERRARG
jgi:succinate-acetate transporter protein